MDLETRVATRAMRRRLSVDLPQNFYMVFMLSHADGQELAQGVLEGVEGLTASKSYASRLFGRSRCFMLEMPGQETWEQNPQLIKVSYGNLDELMENNMEVLRRLYHGADPQRAVQNISSMLRPLLEDQHYVPMQTELTVPDTFWGRNSLDLPINSIDDLTDFYMAVFRRQTDQIPFSYDELYGYVETALESSAKMFADEDEWVLRGDTLKVPRGSTLRIYMAEVTEDAYEIWLEHGRPETDSFIMGPPEGMSREDFNKVRPAERHLEKRHEQERIIEEYDLQSRYNIERVFG